MIEAPDILKRLRDLIADGGRILGVFDRSIVSRSRSLDLVEMLREALPEEMDLARDLLERREEILQEARQQAGDIVDEAVRKAERLVDADAISRAARQRSDDLVKETEQYVAERLAELDAELGRLREEVRAGMRALGARPEPESEGSGRRIPPLDKI